MVNSTVKPRCVNPLTLFSPQHPSTYNTGTETLYWQLLLFSPAAHSFWQDRR